MEYTKNAVLGTREASFAFNLELLEGQPGHICIFIDCNKALDKVRHDQLMRFSKLNSWAITIVGSY